MVDDRELFIDIKAESKNAFFETEGLVMSLDYFFYWLEDVLQLEGALIGLFRGGNRENNFKMYLTYAWRIIK